VENKENKGNLKKIEGIIAVKGPGSFTALRIGLTTANVMAFGLSIPVVGVMNGEMAVIAVEGLDKLKQAKLGSYVMPEYGMEPNITIKSIKA
jgi:tRNA threonylcarbamoyladenosine biosynthesis protein TsaB